MWEEKKNQLQKTFDFKDFKEAFAFMTKIAMLAEQLNHHPTWTNSYNSVSISLSTHDAGSIVTNIDREMAQKIDELAGK